MLVRRKVGKIKMKIITFSAIKGGVGKTTLTFNFGEWLASKGYNVLFIDLDHQCNLTQTYNIYDNEYTVENIFKNKGKVNIHKLGKNLAMIAGYMKMDKIEKELENKVNKDMLLYMWFEDNYEHLKLGEFDYILIDCHPDFSTATRNAIAISHTIISPIIPSEHGYNAKFNIEDRLEDFKKEVINYQTRESYITANLYFVANMIKHNTKSSRELLQTLEKEENIIGIIPEKELFNRSTLDKKSLVTMENEKKTFLKHKKFFDEIGETFKEIKEVISYD